MVKQLHQERGVALFCDLHGHSRTHSAFVYGCRSLEIPESTKIFPYILSKLNPYFSFEGSRFGAYKYKESTARVCMFKELQHVPAVYTLEATFSGNHHGTFYTPEILKSLGRDLCRSLIPYCGVNVPFHVPLPIAPIAKPMVSTKKLYQFFTFQSRLSTPAQLRGPHFRNRVEKQALVRTEVLCRLAPDRRRRHQQRLFWQ